MRTLALDVHARLAEVALHEEGEVRRVGRVATKDLPAFAASPATEDHVVIESTSISGAIVDLIAKHAGRVTISNPSGPQNVRRFSRPPQSLALRDLEFDALADASSADFIARVL